MLKKQKQFNAESAEAEGWRPPRAEARDGTVLGGLGAENRMVSPDFRQTCQRKNRMVSPDFRIADLPPVGRTIAHKTSLSPIHSQNQPVPYPLLSPIHSCLEDLRSLVGLTYTSRF